MSAEVKVTRLTGDAAADLRVAAMFGVGAILPPPPRMRRGWPGTADECVAALVEDYRNRLAEVWA